MKKNNIGEGEFKEKIIIIITGIVLFVVVFFLQPHEAFDRLEQYSEWSLIHPFEILAVFSILMFLVSVFYLRRWKDLRLEIVKRKEVEDKLSRLNSNLKMISQCNQLMVRAKNEQELIIQLCQVIIDFGKYRMCWIGFLEEGEKNVLCPVARAGYDEGYLETIGNIQIDNRFESGFIGEAIRTGRSNVNKNTHLAEGSHKALWRIEALKRGYLSSVALPLLLDNKVIGVLSIYSAEAGMFDFDEVDLLMELADDLVFGIVSLKARAEYNKAAEALHRAHDDLEIRVQKRTFELSKVNVDLQEEVEKYKKAEVEIKTLNKQIEFILGATKTGLDIIDADYNMRYIDPAWQKVYGEYKGKKCYEYFMGRSSVCSECGIARAFKTKQPVITEEILTKEGNRPVEVTTIPYQDEDGNWLVAEINLDITERKKQKKLLKEREELYRKLIDISPGLIAMLDLQGNIVMANNYGVKLYGYSSTQEVKGLNIYKDFVIPKDHEIVRRDINELLKLGALSGRQYHTMKKDKSELLVEVDSSVLKDENGLPEALILMIRKVVSHKDK